MTDDIKFSLLAEKPKDAEIRKELQSYIMPMTGVNDIGFSLLAEKPEISKETISNLKESDDPESKEGSTTSANSSGREVYYKDNDLKNILRGANLPDYLEKYYKDFEFLGGLSLSATFLEYKNPTERSSKVDQGSKISNSPFESLNQNRELSHVVLKTSKKASPDEEETKFFIKQIETTISMTQPIFRDKHIPNYLAKVYGTGLFQVFDSDPLRAGRYYGVVMETENLDLHDYLNELHSMIEAYEQQRPGLPYSDMYKVPAEAQSSYTKGIELLLWRTIEELILGYLEMRLWKYSHGYMKLETVKLRGNFLQDPWNHHKKNRHFKLSDPNLYPNLYFVDFDIASELVYVIDGDLKMQTDRRYTGTPHKYTPRYQPPEFFMQDDVGFTFILQTGNEIDKGSHELQRVKGYFNTEGKLGVDAWAIGVMLREISGHFGHDPNGDYSFNSPWRLGFANLDKKEYEFGWQLDDRGYSIKDGY